MDGFLSFLEDARSLVEAGVFWWGAAALVVTLVLWLSGILPVLFRLGRGLTNRKIAVLAAGANQESMCHLLIDSKLFSEKRLIKIASIGDLGRAEPASVLLVHWADWGKHIEEVLSQKSDSTALILYAPPASIPQDVMKALDEKRNVVVSNFRGRLLNDLVISMITTGYEK